MFLKFVNGHPETLEILNMADETRVRIGLIGAGWIGAHHGRNVIKNPFAELVALAEPDRQKAEALLHGTEASVRVYDDYRELLRQDDVDAVIIASPNAMHGEQAVAAAEASKHIYLEKPMSITLDDCRKVAKAVDKAGIKCEMGYHRRLNPLVQYARKLQEQGQLGEMVLAESDYIHHVPGDWDIWQWAGKERIAGSLIHAGAGHNIDLLRYFCGEVVEVGCFKDIRMPRKIQVETEDTAVINLRFANGALGRVAMLLGPIVPFTFTLRLFGTRGTVDNRRVWLDTTPSFCQCGHENDFVELPCAWVPDNIQGGVAETWDRCLDVFVDDVRLDRQPLNDAVSGFRTAAVCFAAIESAREKKMVVPEEW
jgi:myo-inositol 2-dehydrogenase / D-chiro-inositol 1-dehydrogenase